MNQKAYETLEYNKIRLLLAEQATTQSARELCRLLEPMTERNAIEDAQRNTSDATARMIQRGPLTISGIQDIRSSLKRLAVGSSLSIPELLALAALSEAASRAVSYNHREKEEETALHDSLDPFFDALIPAPALAREIRRCLLSEEEVSDEASPGLKQVRRQMHLVEARVHTQLSAILNGSASYLQDHVVTMRNGRYCLPVKAEHKSHVPGLIHDQSSSGSTFFIEPSAIVQLNNELRALEGREQKEIEAVLASLSNLASQASQSLSADYDLLCQLDFIFAKARLSRQMRGVEPRFNDRRYLRLREARHPLLDPKRVVPIEVELGSSYELLIVTGPNTGGKTVSLKTVGLLTLMGQSGLHIPAAIGSELGIFDEVFADNGDGQSIEQSLSTFSSHMVNLISILNAADPRSLCLFDELCSGTDPVEGAALAMAILTFLHNMKTRTMATTHYSELKLFALSTAGVENASCEFDLESLRPTYRLITGIPGKSNAFAISRRLGLPDYIIEDAGQYIGEQQKSFEDVIRDLETTRVDLEREQAEAKRYREEARQLRERLSRQSDNLEEKRERLLREAREEARRIVQEAKAFTDETIRSVNRLTDESGLKRELEKQRRLAGDTLSSLNEKLAPKAQPQKKKPTPDALRIGDAVRVLSLNLTGTVVTLPNARGELTVQMGMLRSQIKLTDLEPLPQETPAPEKREAAKKQKSNASAIKLSKSLQIQTELNVIGQTVDEAIPAVDKYIDDAYLAHLEQVRIIHGRGTGALKTAIHRMLKKRKHVKSFRLGEFGEGSGGVTVVELDFGKGK